MPGILIEQELFFNISIRLLYGSLTYSANPVPNYPWIDANKSVFDIIVNSRPGATSLNTV